MFLDTSGLMSLFDERDEFHRQAVEFYFQAPRLLTHNYVLAELAALVGARRLPREMALQSISDLAANPAIELMWVDQTLHLAGMELLHHRIDKMYSLCDAISFLLMQHERITDALTNDYHFEQEGFVRLLK